MLTSELKRDKYSFPTDVFNPKRLFLWWYKKTAQDWPLVTYQLQTDSSHRLSTTWCIGCCLIAVCTQTCWIFTPTPTQTHCFWGFSGKAFKLGSTGLSWHEETGSCSKTWGDDWFGLWRIKHRSTAGGGVHGLVHRRTPPLQVMTGYNRKLQVSDMGWPSQYGPALMSIYHWPWLQTIH